MIFIIDIPKNSPPSVKLSSNFDVLRSFLYRVEDVASKHDWKRFLKHLFDLKDVSPVHELSWFCLGFSYTPWERLDVWSHWVEAGSRQA